jgi:hypothetical protein
MTKKLNILSITNELEGSAFFPSKQQSTTPVPEKPLMQKEQPNQPTFERENARPPVRPNGKRIITRNSFEIYEDQMDSLRKHSLQEKMEGKIGSMSQMVREAIDTYLKKSASTK